MVLEKAPGMPCDRQAMTFTIFGLVQDNHLALHIHVTPAQAEQLHFPRTGREGQHDNDIQPRVAAALASVEQPLPLMLREEPDSSSGNVGHPDVVYGVVAQPASFLDCD